MTLIEPGRHLGGMVSGGLGYTDLGDSRVLGGLGGEFMLATFCPGRSRSTTLLPWAPTTSTSARCRSV